MLLTFGIAICLFLTTTVIHAEAMLFVMRRIRTVSKRELQGVYRSRIYKVGAIVIVMFLASVAEVFVWALTYIALNAIEGLERAMYFSMVTYTTLGYGEIVLDEQWRLLASFEAANGIIMFGWSTAIVVAVVHRLYFKEPAMQNHSAAND